MTRHSLILLECTSTRINESIEPFGVYVETSKDFYDKNVWLYSMNYIDQDEEVHGHGHDKDKKASSAARRKSAPASTSSHKAATGAGKAASGVKQEENRHMRSASDTATESSAAEMKAASILANRDNRKDTWTKKAGGGVGKLDIKFPEYYTAVNQYPQVAKTISAIFNNDSVMHSMARLLGNHFQHDFLSAEIKAVLKNQGFSPAACMQQINNKLRPYGLYMKQTFLSGNRKSAKYSFQYTNDHTKHEAPSNDLRARDDMDVRTKTEDGSADVSSASNVQSPASSSTRQVRASKKASSSSATTSPTKSSQTPAKSSRSRLDRSDSISSAPLDISGDQESVNGLMNSSLAQPYDLQSRKKKHGRAELDSSYPSSDINTESATSSTSSKKAKRVESSINTRPLHTRTSKQGDSTSQSTASASPSTSRLASSPLPSFSKWNYVDVKDHLYAEIPMLQERYGKTIDMLRVNGFDFVHFGNTADEIIDLLGFADKKNLVTQMICKRVLARVAQWREQYPEQSHPVI
jgi:hypothetical protein